MPRFRDFRAHLAVALLAIAASGHPVHAGLITTLEVTTKAVAGGLTEYDYTLSDLSASTVNVSFLFIAVDTTASLTALSAPVGWDISYATGDLAVGFTSPDPSVDIVPGSSGAFSFDSPLRPSPASYQVAGIDASGNFLTNDGMILTASVPEPASALLLTAGVLGMLVARRRSKRTRPARTAR
jgi:PEP-CTERM motif